MNILNISCGNKALEFIAKRIEDDKYRGAISSEHNRFDFEKLIFILELLNKYCPNKKLMLIRTTDLSKRKITYPEEQEYAEFCNEVKRNTGIGTQDAMRKNLLVDFNRMGFVKRFDKDKNEIPAFSRGKVKFISISEQGLKLITENNLVDKYFIYSKGLDNLIGGYINIVLDILRNKDYDIKHITFYEYLFFISAIGTDTAFNINIDSAVNLIKEYRNLTAIQRKALIEYLKSELIPEKYTGDKREWRDFPNWCNKLTQIYKLLNETAYFEVTGDKLTLKYHSESADLFIIKDTKRSLTEKELYFSNHNIEKEAGFELHHIIPLSWSESIYHFKLLDKWENMLYIDGYSHAKITQNKNKNVLLSSNNSDFILKDHSNNSIYLKYKLNVLYNLDKKKIIENKNKELIKIVIIS